MVRSNSTGLLGSMLLDLLAKLVGEHEFLMKAAQTEYLPHCALYLPEFPVTHIGFNPLYARKFLRVPDCSFTMLHQMLVGPIGARFLRQAQSGRRSVLTWTVNERERMRWCIMKRVDGVITDDPEAFLEECEAYNSALEPSNELSIWTLIDVLRVHMMAAVFGLIFAWKYSDEQL